MHLSAQGPYHLKSVVFSHGWSDLRPFSVLSQDGSIRVPIRLAGGAQSFEILPISGGISVEGALVPGDAVKALRWMFRLDDDLSPFYVQMKKTGRPWVVKWKMGRLLRSQTIFEDLVKLILTTNCSWSFTRLMTERLVSELGEEAPKGQRVFPTAEKMAAKTEPFYRDVIRAGYRSPGLVKLSKLVASGKVNPESWKDPTIPTLELRRQILEIPGAGPYVADNLLRYLNRNEYLGLDSWARGKLKKMWMMKKLPSDKTIQRKYKVYGAHRGLTLWCDLTRDWFEDT